LDSKQPAAHRRELAHRSQILRREGARHDPEHVRDCVDSGVFSTSSEVVTGGLEVDLINFTTGRKTGTGTLSILPRMGAASRDPRSARGQHLRPTKLIFWPTSRYFPARDCRLDQITPDV
jgi:hypothetical protein